jgi:hypothetical protein
MGANAPALVSAETDRTKIDPRAWSGMLGGGRRQVMLQRHEKHDERHIFQKCHK